MIQPDKPEELSFDNGMSTWQRHFNYIQESDSFNDNEKALILPGLLELSHFFSPDPFLFIEFNRPSMIWEPRLFCQKFVRRPLK